MTSLLTAWYSIQDFVEQGGPVLWVIFATCFLLWLLILERIWYLRISWPRQSRRLVAQWNARTDCRSWRATKIRELTVSEVRMRLGATLPLIKVLVALCPLLGLLGTVTGMIEVFEVMAISGSGNPRSMASGVSKATVPTMAGMVAALSGVAMSAFLENKARREREFIADELIIEAG